MCHSAIALADASARYAQSPNLAASAGAHPYQVPDGKAVSAIVAVLRKKNHTPQATNAHLTTQLRACDTFDM